jgi:hypothetical protein
MRARDGALDGALRSPGRSSESCIGSSHLQPEGGLAEVQEMLCGVALNATVASLYLIHWDLWSSIVYILGLHLGGTLFS